MPALSSYALTFAASLTKKAARARDKGGALGGKVTLDNIDAIDDLPDDVF